MDLPNLHAQVEETCMNAWPALREVHFDGWLIRMANGVTRRTNSVNIVGPARRPPDEKIDYCEAVYRAQRLPCYFRIPSYVPPELDKALAARGYRREDETLTLYMNFARNPPPATGQAIVTEVLEQRPSREWLLAHARHARLSADAAIALHAVLDVIAIPVLFAEARSNDGSIASVGLCGIHRQIACLQWVATDPTLRRMGYSHAALSALLVRAQMAGARAACLQVLATNTAAIGLYRRLGFTRTLYTYHYRVR